ncbi:MAG: twin-arginine translocase TatA/TatE family subunit [Acidobacteria bacterium]|nr:MAG: twin-arginine translocase TatA/TatE family subunit [Acidobacteriota bacterium]REJ98875.1 MAG: twin-arginine translocase TatA/TatE family subunit [Acidobacteriota bacterium]REK16405.1 MAG: twin-arginine translocase TatA/TatE family subunit [Acidobacteriota bacterium]REK44086.1 MAG: twin-arginine translocase TatA/TatE family subunit [Acidobacteriota bacterium]
MLGTTEIILIVLAIFLLFGASRLPKLAKSLGESRRAFKEGMDQAEKEFKDEEDAKQLNPESRSASDMSDDELAAEMQRRQASQS